MLPCAPHPFPILSASSANYDYDLNLFFPLFMIYFDNMPFFYIYLQVRLAFIFLFWSLRKKKDLICLTAGSKTVNIYSQILTSKYLWLALFKQYLFKSYVPNLKELKNNLITFVFVSWAQYNHLLCIHIYHLLRIHPGMLCFFYRGKKRVHKTTITYLPLPTQPNRALEA